MDHPYRSVERVEECGACARKRERAQERRRVALAVLRWTLASVWGVAAGARWLVWLDAYAGKTPSGEPTAIAVAGFMVVIVLMLLTVAAVGTFLRSGDRGR